jgi:hypothetical protein
MTDSSRWTSTLQLFTPLAIALVGGWFNIVYQNRQAEANAIAAERAANDRQQQLLIDKANVIKQYFEFFAKDADQNQQRAALSIISQLGYADVAASLVAANPTADNVKALGTIGASNSADSNAVLRGLEVVQTTSTDATILAAVEQATSVVQGHPTAIVAGADRTLVEAQTEVARIKALGFSASIVERNGWFRTVVPVQDSATSAEVLKSLRSSIRPGAYGVDLKKWCGPNATGEACEARVPP